MAESRDLGYLTDILDAAHGVRRIVGNKTFAEFDNDYSAPLAVVKLLEVIGEATKNLSKTMRVQHPRVPWRKMAGLRDILVHRYREANNEQLFKIAVDDIPKLISEIETMMPAK